MILAGPSSPNSSTSASTTENSCVGQNDGIYLYSPCATGYKKCIRGHELRYSCDPGLFYNPENGFCEDRANVHGCNQANSETTSIPPHEDESCKNLSDGIHISTPCSPNFLICKSGRSFKGHCGKGLLFNLELLRCDYQEKILGCLSQTNQNKTLPLRNSEYLHNYAMEYECFKCWYFIITSGSITILCLLTIFAYLFIEFKCLLTIFAYLFIEFKWKRSLFGHICNRTLRASNVDNASFITAKNAW
uniref:Chitin-binding type-2 domain-containing protein n=1 Tax=Acrobeloides nanus TaxID=290746 RepID=A0A914BUY6_9BILA